MKKFKAHLIALLFLSAYIINPWGVNIFELPKQTFLILFITISLIIFSVNFLNKEKSEIKIHKGVYSFIIFWILILTLSSFFSFSPLKSIYGEYMRLSGQISHLIYILAFLLVFNTLKTKKDISNFLKTILIISVPIALHAIAQKFGFFLIFSKEAIFETGFLGRSFSTFGNPNLLGQFLIFPLFICIYFAIETKKKLFYYLSVIFFISLFFTENRASILGAFAGVFILILYSKNISKKIKVLLAILLLSIITAIFFNFTPSLRSLGSRIYLWEIANKTFIENPILGTGLETFDINFHKHVNDEFYKFEPLFHYADRSHNEFLDIQSQTGIFGFIIYMYSILIFFYLFLIKKRKDNLEKTLISLLFALCISNFFGFSLTINFLTFYTILALLSIIFLKHKTLRLNYKYILIIPLLLIPSLIITTVYLKNFNADLLFKSVKEGQKSPYETLEKAILLNPYQSEIYYYYANFLKNHNYEYKEILQKAGNFENYNSSHQIIKAKLEDDPEKAITILKTAKQLAPKNNEIRLLNGKLFFETEKYHSAINELEEIIKIAPPQTFYSKNEIKRDQIGYETFLRQNRQIQEIFNLLIQSHRKIGNHTKSDYYKNLKERNF